MRMKKILAMVLTVVMILSSMQIVAFAETESNISGEAFLDNVDCKQYESMKDLENLPLILTIAKKEDPSISASLELKYDDEYEQFDAEAYNSSPEMAVILEDIFNNQSSVWEPWLEDEITEENFYAAVFEGYTVTLSLGEDSHWTAELFDGGVTTTKTPIYEFESLVALMIGLYNLAAEMAGEAPIELPEEDMPQTYEEFMLLMANLEGETTYNSFEAYLRDPVNELSEEVITEVLTEIAAMDAALAQARAAQDAPIELYLSMVLRCDCPVLVDYEVLHQYLVEIDGKLVEVDCLDECELIGSEEWYLQGEEGQTVRSEDYVRTVYEGDAEEYAGKTFTYVGSYDSWSDWGALDADLSEDVLEEYTLSEDGDYSGFVLRYVLKEEPKQDAEDDQNTTETTQPEDDSDVETAPLTGDHTTIGLYALLLLTALAALTAMVAMKKAYRKE